MRIPRRRIQIDKPLSLKERDLFPYVEQLDDVRTLVRDPRRVFDGGTNRLNPRRLDLLFYFRGVEKEVQVCDGGGTGGCAGNHEAFHHIKGFSDSVEGEEFAVRDVGDTGRESGVGVGLEGYYLGDSIGGACMLERVDSGETEVEPGL
jgi:hypothetical protein